VSDESIELTRRKVLAGVTAVGAAGAGVGFGTSALFSDEETFGNNRVVAGQLDMRVAWESYYSNAAEPTVDFRREGGTLGNATRIGLPGQDNGTASVSVTNQSRARTFLEDTRVDSFPDAYDPLDPPEDPCPDGLGDADRSPPVIELADVKPGDFGSAVFDFALCDNPGFVWLRGRLRAASENGVTEPEADSGEEEDGVVELLDAARAAVWVDDGDGIQDGDESLVASGTLRQVLNALAAGEGLGLPGDEDAEEFGGEGRNCFSAGTTHSVVFAWRVPVGVGNQIQSDRVEFDLGFYTEQCRHNAGSSGLGYLPQSKLVAESGDEDDEYGRAVAVDGNTAMVGAPNGSVFVLERDGDEWIQTQVLETTDDSDEFGTAIDIDGDAALVSAPGANAAYIYTRNGENGGDDGDSDASGGNGEWTEAATLDPSGDPTSFGYEAVALDGDTAVVSGYDDAYVFERGDGDWSDTMETEVTDDGLPAAGLALDGDTLLVGAPAVQNFRSGGPGKVYVYENGGGWSHSTTLEPDTDPPAAYQDFGAAVALTDSAALVGAPRAGESGAVYVYNRDWERLATLTAATAAPEADFGRTVTVAGSTALIGAPSDGGSAGESGAAYVFDGQGGWSGSGSQQLVATDGDADDKFGSGIALGASDGTVFVGAREGDGAAADAGAVYVFTT